jgi:hypothetical protein
MAKRKEQEHVMEVLVRLAEEENKLTETMIGMFGKTNELAIKRTASADLRTST